MGVQEIVAAIPTIASGNDPNGDLLRTELVQGVVGFIPASTSIVGDILQVDPVDAALGGVRQAYVYGSDAGTFVYDALDSTTAQDLIFCIVLIGGKRYKRIGKPTVDNVISRTTTSPPDPNDSPPGTRNYGDAYLYLTGSWATKGGTANQIGVWSSLGGGSWQWVDADYGPPLYIRDEDAYVHWAGDGGWVDGIGAGTYPAASIPPSAFIWDNRVENQTTNSPPSTWTKGVAYIIGSSASVAWAGNAGKIALALIDGVLADGDAFTILTPFTGQQVFDKALGYRVSWNGTAWVSAGGSIVGFAYVETTSGGFASVSGSGAYSYSAATPPAGEQKCFDTATLTYTAKRAGALLRFRWRASNIAFSTRSVSLTSTDITAALYRDSVTAALKHARYSARDTSDAPKDYVFECIIAAPDADSHTYKIAFTEGLNGTTGYDISGADNRIFSVEELA